MVHPAKVKRGFTPISEGSGGESLCRYRFHPTLTLRSSHGSTLYQSNAISEAIQLLPLYSMALQKNVAFRGGTDVRTDERACVQSQLANMPIDHSRCFTYPRMFRCAYFSNWFRCFDCVFLYLNSTFVVVP